MVPAVVGAQGVTLDSCRSWARSHYPLVEQYGLVAQSAEYSVVNASRAWLPMCSRTFGMEDAARRKNVLPKLRQRRTGWPPTLISMHWKGV